jgi:23S rRNA (cytosine1962-C5)-methyltransferase
MAPSGRLPEVRLHRLGARRFSGRHPWVFKDDVKHSGASSHGDVVCVLDDAGRAIGTAFWSARSKIALRRIARGEIVPDPGFWAARAAAAVARREVTSAGWEARRLVFGENDGLPGLVVDLYGRHLVVQALTRGAEGIVETVVDAIAERLPVDSVLARNDPSVRTLEGLPREVRALRGTPPDTIPIAEGDVSFEVDPWRGQKTGAFLDQRENRIAAASLARGRVLDAFSYQLSFGLHAARHALEVVAVDASAEALARARLNAEAAGLTNVRFVEANAFEDLRERERRGERFDLVVLDPPAFAKSRRDVPAARRGYKEINLRAMRLLTPGGALVTSSCSYNLDEPSFEAILREAAADAACDLEVVARRGQAADHPVLLGFPESRYLKCFFLRRTDGGL